MVHLNPSPIKRASELISRINPNELAMRPRRVCYLPARRSWVCEHGNEMIKRASYATAGRMAFLELFSETTSSLEQGPYQVRSSQRQDRFVFGHVFAPICYFVLFGIFQCHRWEGP